jgi:hypothetical protein
MTLPVKLEVKLLKFQGLVDVIKAHTKAQRELVNGFKRLNWLECEREYWERWRDNALPAIVKERAEIPTKAAATRKARLRQP